MELLEPPPVLVPLLALLLLELPALAPDPPLLAPEVLPVVELLPPLPDPAALLLLALLPEEPAVAADAPLLLPPCWEEAGPPEDEDPGLALLPVWDALPEEPGSGVPRAHSPLLQV